MGARNRRANTSLLHFAKTINFVLFFTSQVGATKVLRYVSIPGKYDGALPYKKGDKAWAT
ncbi:hypothetical protein KUC3_02960 [Alteromonas sp. KC3]|nr:hypothetical protein KUC3_02960 [Alteromonas sp. KC3]